MERQAGTLPSTDFTHDHSKEPLAKRAPGPDDVPKVFAGTWLDLKGRPVNKSKTGGWKGAVHVYGIILAQAQGSLVIGVTLLTYLVMRLNQSISHAATDVSNLVGTTHLLTILGGFIADSYLGSFWTISIGSLITSLAYGLLTFSVSYTEFRATPCIPGPGVHCHPAGTSDTFPLYLALYMGALGSGLVQANASALGADQFDDTIPKEREQSTHIFLYVFFAIHAGSLFAFFLGVYLAEEVSPGWCYGVSLILFVICACIFLLGARKYRHRPASGSFLTRMAQVFVAALRKRNVGVLPGKSTELYETAYPVRGMFEKLPRTPQLRILDRAAAITIPGDKDSASRNKRPWSLCTVTQVEETKRILQLVPIWIPMAFVGIVTAQGTTFVIQMSRTFDRNLGPHFTIPPASLNGIVPLTCLFLVVTYDRVIVPIVRRFTKNPYGFTPLQRLGAAIFFALLTLITSALVERKRLGVVRDNNLQDLVLGTYELPLKFWWMVPIFVLNGISEFLLVVSEFEFFYNEASMETRSIGSTFAWSALSMGFFFSSILVKLVNRVTTHQEGGAWLEGQLNDGGIQKYFWLLSVIMAIIFVLYLFVAWWYTYKYDWYHVKEYKTQDAPQSNVQVSPISEKASRDTEDAATSQK